MPGAGRRRAADRVDAQLLAELPPEFDVVRAHGLSLHQTTGRTILRAAALALALQSVRCAA